MCGVLQSQTSSMRQLTQMYHMHRIITEEKISFHTYFYSYLYKYKGEIKQNVSAHLLSTAGLHTGPENRQRKYLLKRKLISYTEECREMTVDIWRGGGLSS